MSAAQGLLKEAACKTGRGEAVCLTAAELLALCTSKDTRHVASVVHSLCAGLLQSCPVMWPCNGFGQPGKGGRVALSNSLIKLSYVTSNHQQTAAHSFWPPAVSGFQTRHEVGGHPYGPALQLFCCWLTTQCLHCRGSNLSNFSTQTSIEGGSSLCCAGVQSQA